MASVQELPASELPPPYGQQSIPVRGLSNELEGTNFTRAPSSTRLKKPIAIPATASKYGSPFLRGYSSSLEEFEISREEFIHFLDQLNQRGIKRSSSKASGPTANVANISFTQEGQIAGESATMTSNSTRHKKNKKKKAIKRARKQIRRANRELFNPKGLHVDIVKLDTLARMANIPILNPRGKIIQDSSLFSVIPNTNSPHTLTNQERHLQSFSPWIAPYDPLTSPPYNEPLTQTTTPRSDKSDKSTLKSEYKTQKDVMKLTSKHDRELSKLDRKAIKASENPEKSDNKIAKIEQKREKAINKLEKEIDKVERKHDRKVSKTLEKKSSKEQEETEKEMRKQEHNESKSKDDDDKNKKKIKKSLWLIITNLDDNPHDTSFLTPATSMNTTSATNANASVNANTRRPSGGSNTGIFHGMGTSAKRDKEMYGAGEVEGYESGDDSSDSDEDGAILTPGTSEAESDSDSDSEDSEMYGNGHGHGEKKR